MPEALRIAIAAAPVAEEAKRANHRARLKPRQGVRAS
jgi:hypothetical protein